MRIDKGKKRTFDVTSFSSMTGNRGTTWETHFFMSGVVSDAKSKGADATTSTEGLVWLRHELAALKRENGLKQTGIDNSFLKTTTLSSPPKQGNNCVAAIGLHCGR